MNRKVNSKFYSFKRLLSCLTIIALMFSMVPVYAAGETLTVGSVNNALPGSLVVVPISVNSINANGFALQINYDSSKLVFVSSDYNVSEGPLSGFSKVVNSATPGIYKIPGAKDEAITLSGTILNITFRVANNAAAGSTSITASAIPPQSLFSLEGNNIPTTIINGTVTIAEDPAVAAKNTAIQEFKAVRDHATTGVTKAVEAANNAKTAATLVDTGLAVYTDVTAAVNAVNTANKTDDQLNAMADAAAVNIAKTALSNALATLATKVTALNNAQTTAEQNASTNKADAIVQFKAVRDHATTGVTKAIEVANNAKTAATLVDTGLAVYTDVTAAVNEVNTANKTDDQLNAMADAAAVNIAKTALSNALATLSAKVTALNNAQSAAQNAAATKAEAITQFKAVRDHATTGVTKAIEAANNAKTAATLVDTGLAVYTDVTAAVNEVNTANKTDDQLNAMADAAAVNIAKTALSNALATLATKVTALNNAQAAAVAAGLNAVTSYANSLTATYTIYGDQPLQVTLVPTAPAGITVTGMPALGSRPAAGAAERVVTGTLTISKDGQQTTKAITIIIKPALNQLQEVVVAALGAAKPARDAFVANVLNLMTTINTTVTADMISKTRALGITETMMTNTEIANALKLYAPYSNAQKLVVNTAISAGLPAESEVNSAGMPGIRAVINGEITGNPNNNVGIRLFKKMVDTVYAITNTPFAKDTGTSGAQIDFDITGHDSIKGTLSSLISSIDSLEATIASYSGTTNLDKLFNYAEHVANNQNASEVSSLKTFLGSAYTRTYTPPVEQPQTPSTPTTPTAPVADTNVSNNAKEVDNAATGTQPINDPSAINDAINQAVNSLMNTDENKQTANIRVVATQIIGNAAEIANKVADTAKKEEFIATTTNAIAKVVEAAATVKTEANAIALAKSFKTISQEINTLTSITSNTATQHKLIEQQGKITETMKNVAQNVIANVGTYKATGTETNGAVVVSLSQQAANEFLAKADAAVTAANKLNTAMAENGINDTVEKKLVLEVATSATARNLKAELPSNILDQVKAKGIEKVQIESGVAKLAVRPDFISKTNDTQKVSLEVQKVAVTDELKNTLSEANKKLVEEAGAIYDFNAMLVDASNKETKVSSFNSSIQISLPYTLKAGENKDNIAILYLADDGNIKNMAGKYDEATGTVVFDTNHFSKYLVKNNVVKFSDIADSFWAKKEIESMAAKGIVSGKAGNKYDPLANITRAEFATMLVKALGLEDAKATASFKDVNIKDWHYNFVAAAVKYRLISGMPDGTFGANQTITRQDMAIMLTNAMVFVKGQEKAKVTDGYIDRYADKKDISGYAVEGVSSAAKYNLMSSKPGNLFDPKGKVTRAEAAAVIYRLFNK